MNLWTTTFCFSLISSILYTPIFAGALGNAAQLEAGKTLYMAKCSQCHGISGDGQGDGSEFFRPLPRNFTSGAFKIRTTESGELPTDADLKSIIKRGMPYTGMPAWPKFSDEELNNLVYFIKTFNTDFADTSIHPKTIDIPKAPAYSEASVSKGRTLYEENKCLDCHGKLGRGDGESAPTLKDDWGHRIRPADLTRRWTFRGGPKREDIYCTFMAGLNGTPMPSFASSIAEKDRWALVDYIYSLSPSDAPTYDALVTAEVSSAPIDIQKGRDAFKSVKAAFFPVIGQVIEERRNFFPGTNAVEVRAIYDSANIAILVSWHDMSAQKEGSNSPLEVTSPITDSSTKKYSDAVAVQIPYKSIEGVGKPYFLFGDKRNPVEITFCDLAHDSITTFIGKGAGNLTSIANISQIKSGFDNGEWWTIFLRKRHEPKRLPIDQAAFIPIAFSVWDGESHETGNSRGVTSWVTLYLKPAHSENPLGPAAKNALFVFAIVVGSIWILRKQFRGNIKSNSPN